MTLEEAWAELARRVSPEELRLLRGFQNVYIGEDGRLVECEREALGLPPLAAAQDEACEVVKEDDSVARKIVKTDPKVDTKPVGVAVKKVEPSEATSGGKGKWYPVTPRVVGTVSFAGREVPVEMHGIWLSRPFPGKKSQEWRLMALDLRVVLPGVKVWTYNNGNKETFTFSWPRLEGGRPLVPVGQGKFELGMQALLAEAVELARKEGQ